jgi:hypothetical protein
MARRALTAEDVRRLLCGPDRGRAEGARDFAFDGHAQARCQSLRSLFAQGLGHPVDSRTINSEVQGEGGRERALPLPDDVRAAIRDYLKLDESRRRNLHSDGDEAFLFQPLVNYRNTGVRQATLGADVSSHREP